jgi:hypothetical protein
VSTYTSTPAVVDKLEALFVAAVASHVDVQVTDGFPGTTLANDIVAIGGTTSNTEEGTSQPAGLGIVYLEEDYVVHCAISCYRGGNEPSVQRAARDAAYALLDSCLDAVYADPTLGGLVGWCIFDRHDLKQTDYNDATNGRTATVSFTLRVYARLKVL